MCPFYFVFFISEYLYNTGEKKLIIYSFLIGPLVHFLTGPFTDIDIVSDISLASD